ncbi:hypothetical protein CBR_g20997 [Chara braunii]|uniref:Membrane insertase YidC/Oxa/ALB C-terminal domain-containing protein n=1 Tax=Chara braunii TaxID=69332 RepID=A0A388L0E9_CHABU|nr:hypothetical protein CBR_g20997 [Chara braunii]|eukprot:GBG75751.1 hypothetical protein CBR_g20997 [Chara braunii]
MSFGSRMFSRLVRRQGSVCQCQLHRGTNGQHTRLIIALSHVNDGGGGVDATWHHHQANERGRSLDQVRSGVCPPPSAGVSWTKQNTPSGDGFLLPGFGDGGGGGGGGGGRDSTGERFTKRSSLSMSPWFSSLSTMSPSLFPRGSGCAANYRPTDAGFRGDESAIGIGIGAQRSIHVFRPGVMSAAMCPRSLSTSAARCDTAAATTTVLGAADRGQQTGAILGERGMGGGGGGGGGGGNAEHDILRSDLGGGLRDDVRGGNDGLLSDSSSSLSSFSPPTMDSDLMGHVAASTRVSEVAAISGDYSFPVAGLQHLLESVHVHSGLPWWASIALTTLAIRTLLVPVSVFQMRATARLSIIRPQLERISERIKESNYDPKLTESYNREMKALFQKHKCSPFSTMMSAFVQAPLFIGFFLAIRSMASELESFKHGGALWFTDLSTPDPFYILPILSSATFLVNVELGATDGMQGQPIAGKMKTFLRVLGVAMIPLAASFPKALFCYWLPSNLFSLIHTQVLKRPAVRQYFDIPDTSHLEEQGRAKAPALTFSHPPSQKLQILSPTPEAVDVRTPLQTLQALQDSQALTEPVLSKVTTGHEQFKLKTAMPLPAVKGRPKKGKKKISTRRR